MSARKTEIILENDNVLCTVESSETGVIVEFNIFEEWFPTLEDAFVAIFKNQQQSGTFELKSVKQWV